MKFPALVPLVLSLLSLSTTTTSAAGSNPPSKNAILLSNVQSLTLRAGQKTSSRRTSPVPQLKCISSKAICDLHAVDVMRCRNAGSGYSSEDIQWSCAASLPPELKLGGTEVGCEGYRNSEDDYVLKGSCGVEYRLVLTEEGERKFPNLAGGGGGGSSGGGWGGQQTDWSGWIFAVIFVGVAVWIVASACLAAREGGAAPGQGPRWRGGGGGGPGGGWWPGGGGGGGAGGGGRRRPYDDAPPPYSSKPSGSQGGWQPGFWSGAASGAAAGYLAGQRSNRQQQQDYGSGWGSSGWGSGSRGSGSGWGSSRGSSSSSSGSTSAARYESTGFGGTNRR